MAEPMDVVHKLLTDAGLKCVDVDDHDPLCDKIAREVLAAAQPDYAHEWHKRIIAYSDKAEAERDRARADVAGLRAGWDQALSMGLDAQERLDRALSALNTLADAVARDWTMPTPAVRAALASARAELSGQEKT